MTSICTQCGMAWTQVTSAEESNRCLRCRYPGGVRVVDPTPVPWTGTWCPQCGPDVACDDEGCCTSCGATCVGEGVEQALAWRAGVPAAHPPCGPSEPMTEGEMISPEWWRSPACAFRGPVDTILRLLEQEEISRRKALELLAYLYAASPYDLRAEHVPPPPPAPWAPWAKLNWCDDLPDITVRKACRRRMKLGGADAQALEHALTITERERDDARRQAEDLEAGVAAGRRAAQACREVTNALRAVEEVLDDRKAEDGPSIARRVEMLCDVAGERDEIQTARIRAEDERDSIRAVVDAVDVVLHGAGVHHASRAEAVKRVLRDRDVLLLCRRSVDATQAFIACGQQPTLDPGGSAEYRKSRRAMEQAHAAAVAAMAGEAGTDDQEERCNQCGRRREPWQSKDDARCPMHAVPEPYSSCDGTLVTEVAKP